MDMFVDFRKDRNEYETLPIKDEDVRSYKYLGVYIDDQLNFSENAQYLFKKGIGPTAYPLLEVNNMKVDKQIMSLFYRYIVESLIAYPGNTVTLGQCLHITCWFATLCQHWNNVFAYQC